MAQDPGRWGWSGLGAQGGILAVALGLVGVVLVHHPMILAGMGAIQTDTGDTRLILYLLEHTYLWVQQAPSHRNLWSPPMFYPAPNIGAYSDLLLTFAPPYWALRASGLAADSALQGWMIAVTTLNYGAALVLFRRGYRFAWPSAVAGAFLVAFATSRTQMLGHQQMAPAFFALITLFALARLWDEPRPSSLGRWVWWQFAVGSVVAQLYGGFYVGWFLILGLGAAGAWGLALPRTRWRVAKILVRDALAISAALAVGALALQPFLTHYLAAARELGPRDYPTTRLAILVPWGWLDVGPGNWVWGWTADWSGFGDRRVRGERHAGLGLVTTLACGAGWWLGRERPLIRIAAPVAATLMAVATFLPCDDVANLSLAITLLLVARFARDEGQSGPRLAALALVLGAVAVTRLPDWRMINLVLFLMTLVLIDAGHHRREPARLVAAVVLLFWLGHRLFDSTVMVIGLGLVGLAVAALEILLKPADRALVRLGGLGAWLIVVGAITYPDRPAVGGAVLLTPLLLRSARWRVWDRVEPRPLLITLGIALVLMPFLGSLESPWQLVNNYIPGGRAIRAPGRIGLAVLIPAALGLAALFASPWASRRPVWAGLLGLACLVEQGLTTPSYNKHAERARIDELARLVDPRAQAFYFRPKDADLPKYLIDALLMSLQTGVPTVNGYSGGWPRDWNPLIQIDWDRFESKASPNPLTPRQALALWLKANALTLDQVQVIGKDLDRTPVPIPGR